MLTRSSRISVIRSHTRNIRLLESVWGSAPEEEKTAREKRLPESSMVGMRKQAKRQPLFIVVYSEKLRLPQLAL